MKGLISIFILIIFALFSIKIYSKDKPVLAQNEDCLEIAHKEVFGILEYGKVIFRHQRHIDSIAKILNRPQELVCQECHIKDKDNLIFLFQQNLTIKNSEELKNLYHVKCINCHQRLSAQGKNAGPEILSCRDCHKKREQKVEIRYPIFEFDFYLHDKHVKKHQKDCSICHHIYDIEEQNRELALVYEKGTEESCYYCHDFNKKAGPEISKILSVAKEKDLNIKNSFHKLCLNCHIQNRIQNLDSGPIECSECHRGKYRTVEELKQVLRPERHQPDKVFLKIEEGRMKGVGFNHYLHEQNNKTCRICHHERLKPCRDCHSLKGKEEGGFVSILTAFHSLNSDISCQGCHNKITSKRECSGCHYFIAPIKTEVGNRETCARCHTDKREIEKVKPFNVISDKVKEDVLIKHIENEFEPAKMPHYRIIKKLTDISNNSSLATYFHKDLNAICKGCHHKSKEETEAQKRQPPLCISCHSISFESKALGRPRLQSAYHTMCIKCHENMGLEKPKRCNECHERKRSKRNVYN